VADDECHLFGRAQACGDKQVALALAIVVIGDDDKLAAREGTYGRADTLLSVVHIFVFASRTRFLRQNIPAPSWGNVAAAGS
jgi:hypothetical protein